MTRMLVLIMALVATPLFAVDLADSYVKLFQVQVKLAQSGNAGSLYSLGNMYEQGMGTPADLKHAYEWYEKAAKKGDIRAKHKMSRRSANLSKADDAILKAHEARINRALMKKKRARAQRLVKRQRARAQLDDMEDQ